MFTIDQEILAAAHSATKERYIQNKLKEYAKEYPARFQCAGEEKFREYIELSLAKAEKYTMKADREVNGLALLMYHFGSSFDEDPLFPWARFPLAAAAVPNEEVQPFSLLQRVYDRFAQFSSETLGKDYEYLIAALKKIRHIHFDDLVQLKTDQDIFNFMYKLYPERYLALRESNMQDFLLPAAQKKAVGYGFHPHIGKIIFAALIFSCGIAAETDPLNNALLQGITEAAEYGQQKEQALLVRVKALAAINLQGLTAIEDGKSNG